MEAQAHRKELGSSFNSLICRRLESHNQAAQYPPIPSWFIPEYRGKKIRDTQYHTRIRHGRYIPHTSLIQLTLLMINL